METRTEIKAGKIFSAIPKIMLEIEPIGKNQSGRGIPYKFRGIDDLYNAVQKIMAKNKDMLV
jgi:hypothetical protein